MKFIFEVRMKPGYTVDEYAEAWIRASEVIQRTPGALGTRLHRKIGEPDTLLAIASWGPRRRGMPRMTIAITWSRAFWRSTRATARSP